MKIVWISVLLAAVILRVSLFIAISHGGQDRFIQSDSISYLNLADDIITGKIFSSPAPSYIPEHTRTPLYPLFLSAFKIIDRGTRSIIAGQILVSLATLILVIYFAHYVLKLSVLASAVSGLILAADLPSVILANSMLTETVFTFLLLAGVIALLNCLKNKNMGSLALSGILFGLCSLCRPVAFLLPIFMVIAVTLCRSFSKREILVMSVILAVVYAATLSPWVIRNKVMFGGAFLSTISYDNLLYIQAAGVKSVVDKIPYEEAKLRIGRDFETKYENQINTQSMLAVKKLEGAMAASIISAHPFIYASNYVKSIFSMLTKPIRSDIDLMLGFTDKHTTMDQWGDDTKLSFTNRLLNSTSLFTLFACAFQVAALVGIYILASLAVLRRFSQYRTVIIVMISVIVYFCLMSGAPEVYARFRVPVMPFFAVLAAIGVDSIFYKTKNEEIL